MKAIKLVSNKNLRNPIDKSDLGKFLVVVVVISV